MFDEIPKLIRGLGFEMRETTKFIQVVGGQSWLDLEPEEKDIFVI